MYISIDLGGTYTRVASTFDLRTIHQQQKFSTEQDKVKQMELLTNIVTGFVGDSKLEGICMGFPGLVDKKEKKLGFIVNIPYFSNMYYEEVLGNLFPRELIIAENDAALAGLGEATMGAGKSEKVVVYLTLSTGVGGVRINEGRLDSNQHHFEPGHMIIDKNGPVFKMCGQRGCLSAYVSGTAFSDLYKVSPIECTDTSIWKDYAYNLSIGVTNILAMWDPDIVVFGGSMSKKYEEYFKAPLLEFLNQQKIFRIPSLLCSELQDDAGLYGGFVYLNQYFIH